MFQELGLLLLLVLVAILTYSSLVYFAERDVKVSHNWTFSDSFCAITNPKNALTFRKLNELHYELNFAHNKIFVIYVGGCSKYSGSILGAISRQYFGLRLLKG